MKRFLQSLFYGKSPNPNRKADKPIDPDESDSPFPDPIILPLEDVLDLHPFAPRDIRNVVEGYLEECREAGLTRVRLIHGKGKGVQRNSIRALLKRLPYVHDFHDAPPEAGGWGATLVSLKPPSSNGPV